MEDKGTKRVIVTPLRPGYFKAEYEEDYRLRQAGKLINDKYIGYGPSPEVATKDLLAIGSGKNIVYKMNVETIVVTQ